MLCRLALSACLVGFLANADADDLTRQPDASSSDRVAYMAAKSKVGRNAEEHVKLALWCEGRGMKAERDKHLTLAILNDPKQATARGLLGMVEYNGKWLSPEVVSATLKADRARVEALAEYRARRAKTPGTPVAQGKLALWCESKGLKAEAVAHFTAVTRLDPNHEAAWRHLGYKKDGNRWVAEGQLAAEKAEFEAQKKANKDWFKSLSKWRGELNSSHKHEEATKHFEEVNDPRAVAAILVVLGRGGESDQKLALDLLARIHTGASSQALAMLSIFGSSADIRERSTVILRSRDPRDYLGWMVELLRDELKYEFTLEDGRGSKGALFVEGQRFSLRTAYSPPPLPDVPLFTMGHLVLLDQPTSMDSSYVTQMAALMPGVERTASFRAASQSFGTIEYDPSSMQNVTGQILVETEKASRAAEGEFEADLASVQRENSAIREQNNRVSQLLRDVTGHDEGTNRQAWKAYTTDRRGFPYTPEPKKVEAILDQDLASQYVSPPAVQNPVRPGAPSLRPYACFKAGTPVKTLDGNKAIESFEIGDEVLTQNTSSGVLSYQPVLATFQNPPTMTYVVDLGSESISATPFHHFWKASQGWVMTRDLKPGDKIRTLQGVAKVKSVPEETVAPVFNLEVPSGHSFFVGEAGALVHDNSLVQPVFQAFDRGTELEATTGSR